MLPKVAYMDSFSGRNDITTEGSSSPQIVISCPSCSTKFSVDGTAVSTMEHPRFHCSRCDAIFGLAQAKQHEQLTAQDTRNANPQSAETKARPSYGAVRSSPTSPSIKASDFSLGGNAPTPSTELPSVERKTPRADLSHTEQPSRPHNGGWELFDSTGPDPVRGDELQEHTAAKSMEGCADDIIQPTPSEATASAPEELALGASLDPDTQHTRVENLDDIRYSTTLFDRFFGSLNSRSQGLIFMTTPLVATFALLVILSYTSRVSPVTIGATAKSIAPSFLTRSIPKLPPPGVTVKGLKLTYLKTQTKEIVPVISGTVSNNTSEMIDGITLEGIGFNERGEVVLSSQAPLRSALSREKVSDLSLDTVVKFQSSLSARKPSIAPREEVPFTLALLGKKGSSRAIDESELRALKYFSARVFSVK